MSVKTNLLPVLLLTAVAASGGPISSAAETHKIFSKAKAGKYELVKMEFDGTTFQPAASRWKVIYWPETTTVSSNVPLIIVGSPGDSSVKIEDKDTFESRIFFCPNKFCIAEFPTSRSRDERAFYALWILETKGERPSAFNLTGLIEYQDNMLIICFKCNDKGIPDFTSKKEVGTNNEWPELPADISSKKGEKSITYYYRLVQ
jgi:hypothetical protein